MVLMRVGNQKKPLATRLEQQKKYSSSILLYETSLIEDNEGSLFPSKQKGVFDRINNERFSKINESIKEANFNNVGYTYKSSCKIYFYTVKKPLNFDDQIKIA